jgi:hypothetical protein
MYNQLNNFEFFNLLDLGDLSDEQKAKYTSQLVKSALKEAIKTLSLSQSSEIPLINQLNTNQISTEEFQQQIISAYPEIKDLIEQNINKYKQQALLQQIQDLIMHVQKNSNKSLTTMPQDLEAIEKLVSTLTEPKEQPHSNSSNDETLQQLLTQYQEIKTKYKFVTTS